MEGEEEGEGEEDGLVEEEDGVVEEEDETVKMPDTGEKQEVREDQDREMYHLTACVVHGRTRRQLVRERLIQRRRRKKRRRRRQSRLLQMQTQPSSSPTEHRKVSIRITAIHCQCIYQFIKG